MPADEKTTPQVRRIYELLVRTHPGYRDFRIERGWAYARKADGAQAPSAVVTEVRVESLGTFVRRLAMRITGRP